MTVETTSTNDAGEASNTESSTDPSSDDILAQDLPNGDQSEPETDPVQAENVENADSAIFGSLIDDVSEDDSANLIQESDTPEASPLTTAPKKRGSAFGSGLSALVGNSNKIQDESDSELPATDKKPEPESGDDFINSIEYSPESEALQEEIDDPDMLDAYDGEYEGHSAEHIAIEDDAGFGSDEFSNHQTQNQRSTTSASKLGTAALFGVSIMVLIGLAGPYISKAIDSKGEADDLETAQASALQIGASESDTRTDGDSDQYAETADQSLDSDQQQASDTSESSVEIAEVPEVPNTSAFNVVSFSDLVSSPVVLVSASEPIYILTGNDTKYAVGDAASGEYEITDIALTNVVLLVDGQLKTLPYHTN